MQVTSVNTGSTKSRVHIKTESPRWIVIACHMIPFLIPALVYTEWFLAYCILGHAPIPYTDDPKGIAGVDELHALTFLIMFCFPPIFIFSIVFCVTDLAMSRPGFLRGALRFIGLALSWVAAGALLGRGNVLEWFFD